MGIRIITTGTDMTTSIEAAIDGAAMAPQYGTEFYKAERAT